MRYVKKNKEWIETFTRQALVVILLNKDPFLEEILLENAGRPSLSQYALEAFESLNLDTPSKNDANIKSKIDAATGAISSIINIMREVSLG